MEYIASQYSVTEDTVMWKVWFEIIRPDGSQLTSIADPRLTDGENRVDAHRITDELNNLLILPHYHNSFVYEVSPVQTVCNECDLEKEDVRFLDKYNGYQCTDCMPF